MTSGRPERVRARSARVVGAVVVAALVLVPVFWALVPHRLQLDDLRQQGVRLYGAPANGDHMYYASMMLQYSGVPYAESLQRTAEYFHYPADWRNLAFNNPDVAPLVYARSVLPALGAPLVRWMDLRAVFVPGIVCGLLTVLLVWIAARRWGAGWAVAPALALFVVTPAFFEIGTGLYTEAVLMPLIVASVLCLPLQGRRSGWPEVLWLATLAVVASLTRQAGLIISLLVAGGLLGELVFARRPRREVVRVWAAPLLSAVAAGALSTVAVLRWAPYDALAATQRLQGGTSALGSFLSGLVGVPSTFVHELATFGWGLPFQVFVVLSLVAEAVLLVRDPLGWVVLGAAAVPVATAALDDQAVTRYLSPVFPLLVLAQGVVLHRLLLRRARYRRWVGPDASAPGSPDAGGAPASWPAWARVSWGATAVVVAAAVVVATTAVYQAAPRHVVATLSATDYGSRWPFTVPTVQVECGGDDGQVWVDASGRTYALSGTAMARRPPWEPTASVLRRPSEKSWVSQSSAVLQQAYRLCPIPGLATEGAPATPPGSGG